MDQQRLTEIRERLEAATPGPWEWEPTYSGEEWESESGLPYVPQGACLGDTLIQLADTYENSEEDCAFLAHAPQDIADLLAEVDRLQAIEQAAVALILAPTNESLVGGAYKKLCQTCDLQPEWERVAPDA